MKSNASPATPASLLGMMRIGGMVLVFASLSVVASYLVIQKVWIEAKDRGYIAESQVMARLDDLRIAIAEERNARALFDNSGGTLQRALAESDRCWRSVKDSVQLARAASLDGIVVSGPFWTKLENAIQNWRVQAQSRNSENREVAFAELRRVLETSKEELRNFDAAFTKEFDTLVNIRTWVLVIMSGLGGLATWAATGLAIRRTRHSLKRISRHVDAIAQGEHDPRPLESFSEIARVNEKLNDLGRTLVRAMAEARSEGHAARERQRELEFAHELALRLSKGLTESEVLQTFLDSAPAALGAEAAEVLRFVKTHGILEEAIPSESRPEYSDVKGLAVKPRKPRIVSDPDLCWGFRARATETPRESHLSCPASPWQGAPTLCIPMQSAHGPMGVVHFRVHPEAPYSRVPSGFAETLVRLFAPAFENARLLRESIERSTTDPLTGLANRRRLDEYASKAIAVALRQGSPLSVIVLDLDRFKEINDGFGHDEGDRALIAVAKALQAHIRETDLAARTGGDEFAVLLPGSAAAAAAYVVERVREVLGSRVAGRAYSMGLSAGIAELSPRSSTLGEMLSLADRALYDAKRGNPERNDGSLAANA